MAAVAAAVGAKITSHGASGLERVLAAKVAVADADVATRPAIAATACLCRQFFWPTAVCWWAGHITRNTQRVQ